MELGTIDNSDILDIGGLEYDVASVGSTEASSIDYNRVDVYWCCPMAPDQK